ncbi:zeta toxin family protein [Streptomyces neyagawaensis]|uniref:zeta toxin family protein n=1 Tax=Streptomyces neyagawaensis TaxID=42238 RepID=UPI00201CDEC2|nr:zeta toxin family protein [Streptomyces neyagawaensis]MCL6736456.1 zeta toxin family protein [Streptomyces neyagawaensis]MDE1680851.1 zeta toxin family protein [Streptomyces neyagawaensis]
MTDGRPPGTAGEPKAPDPLLHALSPERHAQVYRDVVAPAVLVGEASTRPKVTVLGGQPGSGKSNVARALIGDRDVARISSDAIRELHPKWPELLRADDTTAGFHTHHDARAWVETAIGDAVDRRLDVLFDTAQDDPERTRRLLNRFREAGYEIDVVFVAGGSALSRLGVLERYHTDRMAQGGARFVEDPDRSFPGVLASARVIDGERLADSVTVYRRDGTALYRNTLGADGDWTRPVGTDAALRTERERGWTRAESEWFATTAEKLAKVKPEELGEPLRPRWRGLVSDAIAAARPYADPAVADRLSRLRTSLGAPAAQGPGISSAATMRSPGTTANRPQGTTAPQATPGARPPDRPTTPPPPPTPGPPRSR